MDDLRASIISIAGIPTGFQVFLLIFFFVLCVSPYFSGHVIGPVEIPDFPKSKKKKLKIIGPIIFALLIFIHIPILESCKGNSSSFECAKKENGGREGWCWFKCK